MKNLEKIAGFAILFSLVFIFSCSKQEKMPVTSSSQDAMALYEKSNEALENLYTDKYRELIDQALELDPNLFMAAYSGSIYYLWMNNDRNFEKYSEIAVNIDTRLSRPEKIMQKALQALVEDKNADVREYGKKLVKLYPEDKNSYYQLAAYQGFTEDTEGMINTYEQLLDITDNSAPVYNLLGYAYMDAEKMEDAEQAFNKYIELAPDQPNPYDSKGDYYMAKGDHQKAYEHFMKAYNIDAEFTISYEKAMGARSMFDTTFVTAGD